MRRLATIDPDARQDPGDAPRGTDAASPVRTLLDLSTRNDAALRLGRVRLEPGQRVPDEGVSRHVVEEVSMIVAGSLTGVSGDERFAIEAGDVTWIPAGEEHWATAGPDGAEIFWVWFGDVAGEDAG